MTFKKTLILIILFSCSIIDLIAQVDPQQVQKSPQVADMLRFGNVPIAMNSGRLDLSIPIANLHDKDFDMTISLSYNSSGFMPMKQDGYTGLNWSLNGIGVITREVKGMPDDQEIDPGFQYSGYDGKNYGFLKIRGNNYFKNNDLVINDYINQIPIRHPSDTKTPTVIMNVNNGTQRMLIDASSDIYHFNFGKHSGRFMINYDGSVNVVSDTGGNYQVDITGYTFVNFHEPYATSIIKIKTDDGYVYEFGGRMSNVEYYITSWNNSDVTHSGGFDRAIERPAPFITSFYLSKIIAPNKRELKIEYISSPTRDSEYDYFLRNLANLKDFLVFSSSCSLSASCDMSNLPGYPNTSAGQDRMHNLNKIALVSSISTENESINFSYSNRKSSYMESTLSNSEYLWEFEKVNAQLDGISHYDHIAQSTVESCDLKYEIWGGNNFPRRFLSQLILNKDQKYAFRYFGGKMGLPAPYTTNLDYWNYLNGNYDFKSSLLPEFDINEETLDLSYTSNEREPSGDGYEIGMLESIDYPTGGSTTIEYEQHDYSQILTRRSDNKFLPKLYPEQKHAGGVRVKKITDVSSQGNKNAKEYFYKKDLGSSISSGILFYKPRYYESIHYLVQGDRYSYLPETKYKILKSSNFGFDVTSYENDHVTYSSVIEVRRDDKGENSDGYTITDFSDYVTNPDILFDDKYPAPEYAVRFNDYYMINFKRDLVNLSHTRGKIKQQRIYDGASKLLKNISSKYKYLPDASDKFNLYYKKPGSIVQLYTAPAPNSIMYSESWIGSYQINKVFLYPSLLQEKVTTDYYYDNGAKKDSLVTKESFVYDNMYYLTGQMISAPNGRDLLKLYSHSHTVPSDVNRAMAKKNFLAPIIGEMTCLKEGNKLKLISRKLNNYKIYEDDRLNKFLPVIASEEIAVGENASEVRNEYHEYDDYGNPLQVTVQGGCKNIIYLWSFNGRYMIAKIENSTYPQAEEAVNSIWGLSSIKELSKLREINMLQLKKLYSHDSLKNALITTYTYNSVHGIASSTNPSGQTVFYEYDNWGHLKRSYIKENEIEKNIQSYEYNYSIK